MELKALKEYISETYHSDIEYPWKQYPEYCVFRHGSNKKWFVLLMNVGRDKLGLSGEGMLHIMNVKLDPMMVDTLRGRDGYFPAYHMSKTNWITVSLEGEVSDEEIKNLIDISYELTAPVIRKRITKE